MKTKWTPLLTAGAAVLLGLLVAGCSTQAKRVECDWRLKPINPPAPAAPSHPPKKPQVRDEN